MSARGVTLLELVVALAIAALVATLATAGYERTILRARRLDAHAALNAVASAQERHYLEYARYASHFASPLADSDPVTAEEAAASLPLSAASPDGHYALVLDTDADALAYRITARPTGMQRRDAACATLVLDHTGRRTALDARGTDASTTCWR